jgi:hypothetical protein
MLIADFYILSGIAGTFKPPKGNGFALPLIGYNIDHGLQPQMDSLGDNETLQSEVRPLPLFFGNCGE